MCTYPVHTFYIQHLCKETSDSYTLQRVKKLSEIKVLEWYNNLIIKIPIISFPHFMCLSKNRNFVIINLIKFNINIIRTIIGLITNKYRANAF